MLQFYGAARTGRWGGRDPQPHNLSRPIKAVEEREAEVTDMVREGQYDELLMEFGFAISPIASVVRSSFRAGEGKTFYIADLNAIENRVVGWLSNCKSILDVFEKGLDPYKVFAARMFNKPYDQVTKAERNLGKPPVLGCPYMLGGGDEKLNKKGDLMRTGLWGLRRGDGHLHDARAGARVGQGVPR